LVEKLDSFILNSERKGFDSLYSKVANQYVIGAISNLKNTLVNNSTEVKVESINQITNYELLFLDYYECGVNWEPESHDSLIRKQIESKIKIVDWSKEKAIEYHVETFNIEALSKITQVNKIITSKYDIESLGKEAIHRLEHMILLAKMEVEKACAMGYLGEEKRLSVIAELDGIEGLHKSNQEGVNLPLVDNKVKFVLLVLEENRKEQISKAEEFIKSSFKVEERNKLNNLLSESNLMVFYETIELIKSQKFEVEDETESHFSNFFNNVLSQKANNDAKEVALSLDNRKSIYNIVFEGLPFPQLEEAKRMMAVWFSTKQYSIKSRIDLTFNDLYIILDGIGFKDAEIKYSQRKRNLQYYDFDCTPINDKNRCPIPQFGSIANGKYRLICFWDGPSEEELIDDVKEYTPDEYTRAIIVFNFCKMTQQRRNDLAKVSRAYKSSFLVLDEFLLLYLCGIRGSRLPIFFKLTTPFTYVEPYQTASSNLPQEMFYGRTTQIQQLKNAIGDVSCLIYGGRQLGKTVLQKEVQRIFHKPNSKNFSVYIDLRERGIGNHREIEEITPVLIEDLKIIPNLIPDRIHHNIGIDKLMQKFKIWFDENKEGRILLFLDESDSFLEQDAELEWKHLLPLKGLMEKTNKRFKVIFSGLHDVKRTNEIPNNPLAHLGNPICIGPMIGDDETKEAIRLIELPLENLGFQFHSKDLVYMILSHANWYPS
ncbi:ATP-binding protein, partial [Candidatus Venteria ishoeyi]|uniref:ATP-binding protein n=1 Tax=Candidatus Venteria ishoeyi TaxID=1899563 RepID=UPI0015AA762B